MTQAHGLLDTYQQQTLIRQAQTGNDRARAQLVASNMRLVYHIAGRYHCLSLTAEDLAQEGAIGLLAAIDSFNPAKGARLATYASLCIRSAIHRAVAQTDRMVRLPAPHFGDVARLRGAAEELRHREQREPTVDELAGACSMPVEQAHRLLAGEPVSLDAPLAAAESASMRDLLQDPNAVNPEAEAVRRDSREALDRLLATLPPRDQEVLTLRYGLKGSREHTFAEIAAQEGISGERARRIELRALYQLRRASGAGRAN